MTTTNEATFEARIQKEITRFFPNIPQKEITHQKTFTIKFGRQTIQVNGVSKAKAQGRLDALIKFKDINIAVLELKQPNHLLNSDDIDQGISYARLLEPMPPLVIVSNGSDSIILQTYDRKKISDDTFNEKALKALFNQALNLAASDKDECIKILLGQKKIYGKIFSVKDNSKSSQDSSGQ